METIIGEVLSMSAKNGCRTFTEDSTQSVERRYYGYRVTQGFEEDPRLEHLDPSWFTGKSMLDIGCNDGLLTMALACKFGCQSVTGVDIDSHLISKACRSLSGLHTKYSKDIAAASNGSKCALVMHTFPKWVAWLCPFRQASMLLM